ncbi:DNA polymerase III subunit epsilon [Acinetobacter rudis]|uniref:DNA polymerase III subunit epsilon n=1 Tax=Acinetobacter rudis TaxID=632955 RepID=UPI003341D1E4
MTQTITLYVDGACRGNPGLGGWGAYIITADKKHELCGGEDNTTNNRMELTAAIEGIRFCAPTDKLIVWTDSTYVKRGITEWIEGWKKKNWKDVKNPDLWKALDEVCKNRDIEWNWVKGHAGDPGNEKADQLANQGADQTLKNLKNSMNDDTKKKSESDWLLDDPFGFDLIENEAEAEAEAELSAEIQITETPVTPATDIVSHHPHIVITPTTREQHGPRQLILDTETTGFYYSDGDRIVEVGAIEMINRKLTGSSIHIYINPKKPVGDSVNVHGITDEFLADKPEYQEISAVLFDYLKGSEIIAHNATFDMNFLDMEFTRSGLPALSEVCTVVDTLALAKNKHPGQKNSLDALVRRYDIPQRDRTYHGALLDAEILSDVYLAMTGGQVSLNIDAVSSTSEQDAQRIELQTEQLDLPVIAPSVEELAAHEQWVLQYQEKNGEPCIFAQV